MNWKFAINNTVRSLLVAVGTVVFFNGAALCFVSNINTGIVLTVVLGAILVLWGVFFEKVKELTQKGVFRILKIVVAAAIFFEACLVGYVAYVGEKDTVTYDEQVLIVLGAGIRGERITLPLKVRLDRTLEYHSKNPDALIIVSGGQGQGEATTEAYAMKKYLVQNGVPENLVIEEGKATSTSENFKFSKKILKEDFGISADNVKIAFVTNNFHVFRSIHLAKMSGFDDVTYMHTNVQWYNYVPFYIRETLAIFKMWIFKY